MSEDWGDYRLMVVDSLKRIETMVGELRDANDSLRGKVIALETKLFIGGTIIGVLFSGLVTFVVRHA